MLQSSPADTSNGSNDAAAARNAAAPARPHRRIALACVRCRQQKMKCSGGPAPPCDRCRRAKATCLFEPPSSTAPRSCPFTHQSQGCSAENCSLHDHGHDDSHENNTRTHNDNHNNNDNNDIDNDRDNENPTRNDNNNNNNCTSSETNHHATHINQTFPGFAILADSTDSPSATSSTTATAATTTSSSYSASQLSATHLSVPPLSLPSAPPCRLVDMLVPCSSSESAASTHTRKRRRSHGESGAPWYDNVDDSSDTQSPYDTVQAFEAANRPNPRSTAHSSSTLVDTPTHAFEQSHFPYGVMFPQSRSDRTALLCCLSEVGINVEDARDMFILFSQRIAPFCPFLYNTDMSDLPNDPLFAMSAIRAIARYLPGVSTLRKSLDLLVKNLVRHVVFDDLSRPYETILDTFKGLAIVYGYSEVGIATSQDKVDRHRTDALSVKAIIEGYAIRWNIGRARHPNILGCIGWLWLFTMSNHYSIVLGCPRTLSADKHVLRAKAAVKETVSHPQISALLGEVDLCMLSISRDTLATSGTASVEPHQINDWMSISHLPNNLDNQTAGRMRFHLRFAKFLSLSNHAKVSPPSALADAEALEAARDFLHCVTKASPVSKDKIRYMTDFGFVMLVSVCCFMLQLLEKPRRGVDPSLKTICLQDIRLVADLLKSLSSSDHAANASYGRALENVSHSVAWGLPFSKSRPHEDNLETSSTAPGTIVEGPLANNTVLNGSIPNPAHGSMPNEADQIPLANSVDQLDVYGQNSIISPVSLHGTLKDFNRFPWLGTSGPLGCDILDPFWLEWTE